MPVSRRDFLATTALGSVALALDPQTPAARRPIIICAHNGYNYLDDGYAMLRQGADTLDAALRVVRGLKMIPTTTPSAWEAFPMRKAWSNSTPAACTGPPVAPAPSAQSATSRTYPSSPKPSWSTPDTSCWSAKAPSASLWRRVLPAKTC